MRTRTDYWHNGQRHAIKLSDYALHLLREQQPASYSATISTALQSFLGSTDILPAATAFIEKYDGMNLSLLIETAVIWKYHQP